MADAFKVYCAGPLFTPEERREMGSIARVLEGNGFGTFLPHRDGFEFLNVTPALVERGHDSHEVNRVLLSAIFGLDTYEVLVGCDGLVANLNGEVHDDGTVSEAAMAWATGKPVLMFKSGVADPTILPDNPLVAGLSEFAYASAIEDIPERLRGLLDGMEGDTGRSRRTPDRFGPVARRRLEEGERLAAALREVDDGHRFEGVLAVIESLYLS